MNRFALFCLMSGAWLSSVGAASAALVGFWPFDSADLPGQDLSGNNYSLSLQGATYSPTGMRGGALSLNGTTNYAVSNIVGLPKDNSAYTISAWFKPTATGSRGIIGWGSTGQTRRMIGLRLNGTNGIRHYWSGADLDVTPTVNYSDGRWHHLAAIYDGATRTLFLDGSQIAQDTPGAHAATVTGFRIGSTNSAEYFSGELDEVAVWNQALDPGDIGGLAAGGSPVAGARVTSFTAVPSAAYEGDKVQLAWTVDTSKITGTYSYELKLGAVVLDAGTATSGSFQVTIPDPGGTSKKLTYVLRAIETGGGGIVNSFGVTVAADPGRPVAVAQPFLAVAGSTPLRVTLSGSDPNGSPISYAIATPPAKGTLTGTPPVVTYTANQGATGEDSFTFLTRDGKYDSTPATVTITINPPPAAPTGLTLDTATVPDSKTTGAFLAMMSARDPNPAETHTFSLVPGTGDTDNAKFGIAGFQLRAAADFATLTGQTLRLRLRAVDPTGFSVEQAFTLTVTPPRSTPVINEMHFNGVDNTVLNEFIEINNPGPTTADVSGWRLSGGIDYAFPAGTSIAPGGMLLVAASPPVIQAKFGKSSLGPWTGNLSSDGETLRLRNQAGVVVDEVDYQVGFPWPVAAGGDGTSLEKINPHLDGSLGASWRSAILPSRTATTDKTSAGDANLTFSGNAPPAIRQVAHEPQQPTSRDPIRFTAKVTDPDGVAGVVLSYQIVTPGNYIPRYLSNIPKSSTINSETRLLNPAFELAGNWTTLPMSDDGSGRDTRGGDSIWTAILPPLPHRHLLRYRITVTDHAGNSIRVPYADDPAANFACFIYDGVPAYGATSAAALQTLPVYHLLTKGSDWTDCMAYDTTKQISQGLQARFYYNWNGTFVYDGIVYDNITYRTRGANGRYHGTGKRSMRFKFNRGSYLAVKDQRGKLYPTKWQTLTTGKGFENHGSLTFALNEWLNYRLWNAYGVPAPFAHFAHWRNITTAAEQPDNFRGDFQGLSFIQEDYDVRFFEAHKLPKGNLYKLLNQTDAPLEQQRYQAPLGAKSGADHNWIEGTLSGSTPPATVAANVNLDVWYRSHALCQAVRHYDYWPNANKNMAWYFEPVYTPENGNRGRLWILPFDTDASWGPNWNNGHDVVYNALFASSDGGGDSRTNPTLWPGYFNAVREVRNLLFQKDQINPLIDEAAAIIAPFVPADLARWKGAPADAGNYNTISGPGMTSLAGLVTNIKAFAFTGGSWSGGGVGTGGRAAFLDTLQASQSEGTKIPGLPAITYTGTAGYPVNDLRFQSSAFTDPQGAETFASMQWRIAEITDPTAPAYVAGEPIKLEIETVWASPEITPYAADFRFPAAAARAGHTYRVRVRMKDNTGRASAWSAPVQFTATPANVAPLQQSLVISEIMYHPVPPNAAETAAGWVEDHFEYLELRNIGAEPVTLTDLRFTKGISFDFPAGSTLAPGANLLVVSNPAAFASRYGTGKPVAGSWAAGAILSNGGEEIKLSFGAGEQVTSVTYNDKAPWPSAADGGGSSLVRIRPENPLIDPNLPTSWRASTLPGGSPGGDDRPSFTTWAAAAGVPGTALEDPDHDGSVSLLEYVLSSGPADAKSSPRINASLSALPGVPPSDPYLTLTFIRRDVPGSIRTTVQFSKDLATWEIPAAPVQAVVLPDGIIEETWRSTVPWQADGGPQFGRVSVMDSSP